MPISDNYILKQVGKEYMIIPLISGGVDFSKVYTIPQTGAFIYEKLKNNASIEEIVVCMSKEYDIPRDVLHKDILEFIDGLKLRGIYYD